MTPKQWDEALADIRAKWEGWRAGWREVYGDSLPTVNDSGAEDAEIGTLGPRPKPIYTAPEIEDARPCRPARIQK